MLYSLCRFQVAFSFLLQGPCSDGGPAAAGATPGAAGTAPGAAAGGSADSTGCPDGSSRRPGEGLGSPGFLSSLASALLPMHKAL